MTPFTITRRVEFQDTDMAGIMHFTAFFRFMEVAEHAFLRARGLSIFIEDEQGTISWPRVSAQCDYRAPARFSEELSIEVRVAHLGPRSVTYDFVFTRDGQHLAQGAMTSVCCRIPPDGPPKSIPMPAAVRAKLEE
jgi:YbgC/YbaW family acyl-CoA thioester hydrolase